MKNFILQGAKGEIDLAAYDGEILVFAEPAREDQGAPPKLSITVGRYKNAFSPQT